MTTETRKKLNDTKDFKRDAVALVTEQGYKVSAASRSLGIGHHQCRAWAGGEGRDKHNKQERFHQPSGKLSSANNTTGVNAPCTIDF